MEGNPGRLPQLVSRPYPVPGCCESRWDLGVGSTGMAKADFMLSVVVPLRDEEGNVGAGAILLVR